MSRFVKVDDASTDERTKFFAELLPEELAANKGCRLIGSVDENGIPEGVVAFVLNDNLADILHIEVYEELRRQGIGTAMIRILLQYLSLAELPFVLQAVYSAYGDTDGAVTDAFFRSIPDFEVVSGGRYYSVPPDTVWNAKRLGFIAQFKCSVTPYTKLSKAEKQSLQNDLEENGLSGLFFGGRGKLIPELSLCHLENGVCTACVIFRETDLPDTIELSFLMSKPHKEDHLAGILNETAERIKKNRPKAVIEFCVVNKESELLASRFLPKDIEAVEILRAVSFGEI